MAEEKSFRYGFIILGFFLVMLGMFIMSMEKPQYYITFCVLGVLLVAVGITWSMCQCYPKITFVPADLEAERFLDHKATVLPHKDTGWVPQRGDASSTYEKSLPSYEQIQRQEGSSAPAPARPRSCSQPSLQARAEIHRELHHGAAEPRQELPSRLETAPSSCAARPGAGDAPLASLLEEMDTPSLEGSVPGSPEPQSRSPPRCSRPGRAERGERPRAPRKGARTEDELYYGLREEPDALLEGSDGLSEPEN
ncbi:BSND protein, partial [Passerina amoena]|nr:BSND protein [Passerina amoena]